MQNKVKTIKILKMTNEDLDDVMAIEEKAYGEHHWSRDSFRHEIKGDISYYFCAKHGETGKLLGYIGMWAVFEEAHITTLAVDPDFRGCGIAQVLLVRLIDLCFKLEIKYITLEVRESNNAAIHLYEKFLMQSLGKRKGYYQDNGESALIMWSENIWHDKFKSRFNKLKDELKIEVKYDE